MADTQTPPTGSPLFARQATGLVREVTPFSSYIINYIPGTPVQALGYGLFFAFALFPGGNFLLAGVLAIPLALAFCYAFGLLTSMMPRTGGDYVLVSRVLHPSLGLVSSFCMTVSNVLSVAFFGVIIVTLGLGPGLISLGLVGHYPTLISWGNTIDASRGWQFAIGSCLFVSGALIMSFGWKWTARIQATLFGIIMLGLVVAGGIALFTSHGDFVGNFNSFARQYTHNPNSYESTITNAQKAGIPTSAAFSFSNTVPMIGIFATFGIYSWFSTYVGGELRQARTMKTANIMGLAGSTSILVILVFAAIFLHTFGTSFMTAASSNGLPTGITAAPTYFFLLGASTGSVVVTGFLVLAYLLFFPLITYMAFLQPTRMCFAYAFDGILPSRVTTLSRTRSPYIALILTVALTELVFIWAVRSTTIFTVLVYAVLIQLIGMALVGASAVVVPWRRPELYRAGSTTRTVAGIPVVSLAGAGSLLAAAFVWVLYFHYSGFGLANRGQFWTWVIGSIVAAFVYYLVARAVRRRQGVDLSLVYAEIPPE
jgi:APA family basic amino acid/polyamine antiporter